MTIRPFESILAEFGQVTGLGELALDRDKSCSLLFDGEHELSLTQETIDGSVFLHAPVGDAPEEEDVLREFLSASLLGAQTGGAAFALSGKTLILWKRHDGFEDYGSLEKAINAFLERLIYWKERSTAKRREAPALPVEALPPGVTGILA
jgi:hypothetical protein